MDSLSQDNSKVGVTSVYKDMMKQFLNLPFASDEALCLDTYVTEKAVSGLFVMLAEEEKNIRTNPQARVTDLLKQVFGG